MATINENRKATIAVLAEIFSIWFSFIPFQIFLVFNGTIIHTSSTAETIPPVGLVILPFSKHGLVQQRDTDRQPYESSHEPSSLPEFPLHDPGVFHQGVKGLTLAQKGLNIKIIRIINQFRMVDQ